MFRLKHCASALAAALLLCVSLPAAPVTFANFDQVIAGAPISFTNDGSDPRTFSASDVEVDFAFANELPIPDDAKGSQKALLSITGGAPGPAVTLGPLLIQPLLVSSMTFTRVSDGANLLTVDFEGLLLGQNGGHSAGVLADTSVGQNITFTSDFLSFAGTSMRSVSLSMTGVVPPLGLGPDNFMTSFDADITGTFSSEPLPGVIPEPGTYALMGAGFVVLALTRRRRGLRNVLRCSLRIR